jgi:hypothetical protein
LQLSSYSFLHSLTKKPMAMKQTFLLLSAALLTASFSLSSCSKRCDGPEPSSVSSQSTQRVASVVYPLNSVSDPNISGTATFLKAGSKTIITVQLSGTTAGNMHPGHIHFNSVAVGGGIAVSLTDVNGASGRSVTVVDALDNGTPITYEQLLNFNGYVNIHLSETQLSTIIAQGNIGSNF